MTYIEKEINILASSDTDNGAENVSSDGSQFEFGLSQPIQIPQNARNVKISVPQSTIWWTVLNIETGVNDTLYFDDGAAKTLVYPPGLYDASGFNSQTATLLVNEGLASTLIQFQSDTSTQKIIMVLSTIGTEIDFTQTDTPRVILGFDSQTITSTINDESFFADNVAAFNQVNSFLIHCDLADRGIRTNNRFTQIVRQVLIKVAPGSQIVDEPFIPEESSAGQLKGASKDRVRLWLTNEANEAVNTNNETWTARLRIKWLEKID